MCYNFTIMEKETHIFKTNKQIQIKHPPPKDNNN